MAKVLGVGNALVDALIRLENDQLLNELNLPKGSMTLVDDETKTLIGAKSAHLKKDMASGGSAANTIHGLAKLNADASFIGSVGKDKTGDFFYNDLQNSKINPLLSRSNTPTGIASTLISKDGERTFGTYLGAAIELSGENLTPQQFEGFDIMHVEGYLVQNHELLETILKYAKQAGSKISVDLASYNVVEANLGFLKEMLEKYVDIVFANEEEAKAFTGKEPEEALHEISLSVETAVVKIGSRGSMVKNGETVYTIAPIAVEVTDTTGAGDAYAAGFLFGMMNNLGFEHAGIIGTLLASTTIETLGARIKDESWEEILQKVAALRKV
jgi:sugar/nucleoside kinase (ribokinase family)